MRGRRQPETKSSWLKEDALGKLLDNCRTKHGINVDVFTKSTWVTAAMLQKSSSSLKSSWTGAHEEFQVGESDAGALAQKVKSSMTSQSQSNF